MSKGRSYDTLFFQRAYYPGTSQMRRRIEIELGRKEKYVSSITFHEVYRLALEAEGREVAEMRVEAIKRDFEIIAVDYDIAVESAKIKHQKGRDFPLADSLIAATARLRKLICVTDEKHFQRIDDVRTAWLT